jgi:murein DD-endopeptidase MepM/ murein hydrolase activator NlpD
MILKYPVSNREITSDFGWRTMSGKADYHSGTDYISKDMNHNLFAVAYGTVKKVGNDTDGYGKYLVIQHKGFCTLYAHCNTIHVAEYENVSQGDIVAIMGNTGSSEGRHLHFEIRNVDYNKFWERMTNDEFEHCVDSEKFYLENSKRKESDLNMSQVSEWAKDSWTKSYLSGVNDGLNPKIFVTEEQLMVFLDRIGGLDGY